MGNFIEKKENNLNNEKKENSEDKKENNLNNEEKKLIMKININGEKSYQKDF